MASFKQLSNRAKKLLVSPRAKGNHGFKGAKLLAWRSQRNAFKVALKAAIKDSLTPESLIYRRAVGAMCPRMVFNDNGYDEDESGTAAGAAWVESCYNVLHDIVWGGYNW